MALKSTEEERAVLRARSAVQRFPVVEWRQRMEDFHKRSIGMSRGIAGADAWRESDCDGGSTQPLAEHDDWDPIHQAQPLQPEWDRNSVLESPGVNTPGSPGQWSQDTLTPTNGDYFAAHSRGSTGPETPQQGYGDFLERANRTIARDQRHAPDPFADGNLQPSRPFGAHSRVSSVESISSIVDEKSNSPLNKAIASVSFALPLALYKTKTKSSSLIRMAVSLRNSFRNCNHLTPRTRSMIYLSKSSWSRVRRRSSVRFARTSSTVQPVSDRLSAILYGEHRLLQSILVLAVSYRLSP